MLLSFAEESDSSSRTARGTVRQRILTRQAVKEIQDEKVAPKGKRR